MEEYAKSNEVGAKGLAWTKIEESGEVVGRNSKVHNRRYKNELEKEYNAEKGSAIFFIADEFTKAQK